MYTNISEANIIQHEKKITLPVLIFYIHIFIVKDYNSGVTKCLMLVFNSSSLSTGLKQSPQMPLAHSVLLTEIMDEIRRQVGVVFNQDRH